MIQRKAKWPHWTPTDEMVENNPNLKPVSAARGGLVAGLNNPLGARALYIYQNGKDTLYRVHGTPDWQSVGKATSSVACACSIRTSSISSIACPTTPRLLSFSDT